MLLGVLVGSGVALVGGIVTIGLLRVPVSGLLQTVVIYMPAGFWAGYRARRGHPVLNALCAGGILFVVSSVAFALLSGLAFPTEEAWIAEGLIVAGIVVVAGALAVLFRQGAEKMRR